MCSNIKSTNGIELLCKSLLTKSGKYTVLYLLCALHFEVVSFKNTSIGSISPPPTPFPLDKSIQMSTEMSCFKFYILMRGKKLFNLRLSKCITKLHWQGLSLCQRPVSLPDVSKYYMHEDFGLISY